MRIAMIGAGYVGLVSGACFADFGFDVTCVDLDRSKLERLNRGEIPIYEPGLEEIVRRNLEKERLRFTHRLDEAVAAADVVFIAVGTPSRRGDGHADLTYVFEAAKQIGRALQGDTVVVTKSTVPVGTGDEVERILAKGNPSGRYWVVSNPEFLREGSAIEDFKRPDRVVIGVEDAEAEAVMQALYRPLSLNKAPVLITSRRTAELTKYAGNAFLAMKITFINEIADLCEQLGANVQDVARGIGMDGRIGTRFLHPGPGYGGSCFPKDMLALVRTAAEANTPLRLVTRTIEINEDRKRSMAGRIERACGGNVNGLRIALLGLAFKPNTDDVRDAPSIVIAQDLQERGAELVTYDPEAMDQARSVLPGLHYTQDAYSAAEAADALVIVTEWDEFRSLDLDQLSRIMRRPVLVDLRNIYARVDAERAGFSYFGIGIGSVPSEMAQFTPLTGNLG